MFCSFTSIYHQHQWNENQCGVLEFLACDRGRWVDGSRKRSSLAQLHNSIGLNHFFHFFEFSLHCTLFLILFLNLSFQLLSFSPFFCYLLLIFFSFKRLFSPLIGLNVNVLKIELLSFYSI